MGRIRKSMSGAALFLVFSTLLHGVDSRRKLETVEPWGPSTATRSDWWRTAPVDRGVPPSLFARAMTSLPPAYREDLDLLDAHLWEEHQSNAADSPDVPRAHLCCGDYAYGPAVRSALIEATAAFAHPSGEGRRGVQSALNHPEGYCAIAHMSAAVAGSAPSLIHESARCSPLTHASKEPESLLTPASFTRYSNRRDEEQIMKASFGLRFGESLQDGVKRGLVVSMSPGSLPTGVAAGSTRASPAGGIRGGADRKLAEAAKDAVTSSSAVEHLEQRWRASWSNTAPGRGGAEDFAERISWTSSLRDGDGSRRLSAGDDRWAGRFHDGKAKGYKAALDHLSAKMEADGDKAVSEACGFDNVKFVHARNDVLYLRGIFHPDHDEETSTACLLGLVGFLSAQPDVMHIHPEPRAEANNKVLTAYVEGGSESATPMRTAGLDGSGEVIGVSDTGLDDNSCFFKDENGMVPRTTMEDAAFYPDQRKVVQYIVYADDMDGDGHGTHVAGTAAGAIYSGWEVPWSSQVSAERCEDVGYVRSCFGDCVYEMDATECHWNPELSCPMSGCDEDTSCDDDTGFPFPCFGDPEEELPAAAGMAPGAKVSMFDLGTPDIGLILPDNIGDMWTAQYTAGARIFSNSWSLVTMTEPTEKDVELDEWIAAHPDSIVLFGAGNNGFEDGEFHSGSVQSPATSKTAMTVGASNNGQDRVYGYYTTSSSNYAGVLDPGPDVEFEVSPYSARGPVGRFTAKPEVVAPGLMVHSAKASRSEFHEETCALESYGGTSMSAPAVAGAAALVRQYFTQGMLAAYLDGKGLCGDGVYDEAGLCEAFAPSGYLVKAVLINSAKWLGNLQTVSYGDKREWMTVLDFAQGFGAVQMASGIPTSESEIGAFFHDNELASEHLYYYLIYVGDPSQDLSVTVAWYDPPSTVAAYNLLHDLDTYVMSVSTRTYFRANSYNTMATMCVDDEDCAQKYGFTFWTSLADYMNTVERIVVASEDLEEGYYVVGVRARSITESDTQAYGLAAAGAGLELYDMSSNWDDLGAETQSGAVGGGAEPDPEEGDAATPAPETSISSGSNDDTESEIVLAPPETSSPTGVDPDRYAEPAISETDPPEGSSSASTTAGNGFRSSTSSGENEGQSETSDGETSSSSSSGSSFSAGYAVAGGENDDGGGDVSGEESSVVGQENASDELHTTVVIAASVAGAAVIIAVGMCLAFRRRRKSCPRGDTSHLMSRAIKKAAVGGASVTPGGMDNDEIEEFEMEVIEPSEYEPSERRQGSVAEILPGYATAVAMEADESTVLRSSTGTPLGGDIGLGDDFGYDDVKGHLEVESSADGAGDAMHESETSGFYAAVDPSAVSKLVGWGISRDFARVALRQTDNDIPAALRLVAEGDIDAMLAADLEEMARQRTATAAEEAATASML